MRKTYAIFRKEMGMYFSSPTSYVAFAVYFLLTGYFFSADFLAFQLLDVRPMFAIMMMIFLFVVPLLTMRLVADEFRQGTDELLFTSPLGLAGIIWGKYLASLAVLLLLLVGSMIYPMIMLQFGSLDLGLLVLSYLSLFLLGAAMFAIGLFASSVTSSQMLAGIISFVLLFMLVAVEWIGDSIYGPSRELLQQFSIFYRVDTMQKGVLALSDILFFVMLAVVFLLLSIRVLERKRWE